MIGADDVAAARALLDAVWPVITAAGVVPGVLNREELPLEDPWDPGVSELNLLVRPFMERAGLDDLDVFVELWDGDEKVRGLPDDKKGRPAHRPALWFDTVFEGLCIFAAEAEAVRELEGCLASSAAAVAAAFHDQRADASTPEADRGARWDVCAAALGFITAQLPRPTVLSPDAVLAVVAEVCRRSDLDPALIELAIAPRWHPQFVQQLTNA